MNYNKSLPTTNSEPIRYLLSAIFTQTLTDLNHKNPRIKEDAMKWFREKQYLILFENLGFSPKSLNKLKSMTLTDFQQIAGQKEFGSYA